MRSTRRRSRALALRLGADVPYFLAPRPARVGGIGERSEPLAGLPELACLLVNPGVPLATASVFAAYDARPAPARPAFDPALGLDLGNDLEPAAERLCPGIAPLRERLLALGARAVGLSGSGPTLFGIFPDVAAAARALAGAAFPLRSGPGSRWRRKLGSLTGRRSGVAMRGVGSRRAADPGASPNW